jgi:hypothetical protein
MATAESSADAQLTYSVNATATAIAETTSEAQITRIISAEATATAESSAEANFGITFNAGIEATANVVNADLFRTATMDASVTGMANTTSALTLADNLVASATGSATVTNATLNVEAAVVDPNYANVSLLLHGNGIDGSTTFIDNSPNAFSVSGFGNVQIDTTIKKFGTGSIQFDGNGDNLSLPSDVDFAFGTGDFTIEFFVRFNFVNKDQCIFDFRTNNTGSSLSPFLAINTSGQIYYALNGTAVITTSSVAANVFNHIALVRSGGNTIIYINGSQSGITYVNSSSLIQDGVFIGLNRNNLGNPSFFLNLDGYIDEFRITKGIARYTGASLTVPTAEFPDK